jgi:hypothetical protein
MLFTANETDLGANSMTISEVEAITAVDRALSELDEDAAVRVLRWASEKYGQSDSEEGLNEPVSLGPSQPVHQFDEIADLMAAAGPRNGVERVLVAAYWFQVINEHPNVTGQQVNNALKNLGHAMGNITDAFSSLIRRKPQLAMQVEKTGSSRQARKKYKLTIAGINEVKRMLTPEEAG